MAGKDLIDSVKLSSQIVRALGGEPPAGFNYELFLDDKGQKISKSKGNGLTIDEWLTYASPESLSLFMFQKPMAAKRLYFDVIPRTVDDYLGFLDAYPAPGMEGAARQSRLARPFRRAAGRPRCWRTGRDAQTTVSFAMLLNLAAVANSDNPAVLWGFLRRYAPLGVAAKPIRGSTGSSTTPSLISAISSRRRSAIAPADEVERAALEAVSAKLGDAAGASAAPRKSSTRSTTSRGRSRAIRI